MVSDKERLRARKLTKISKAVMKVFVGIATAAVLLTIFGFLNLLTCLAVVVIAAIPTAILDRTARKARKGFIAGFDNDITRAALKSSELSDAVFEPGKKLDEATVRESGLFGNFAYADGSGYLSGTLDGVRFRFSDIAVGHRERHPVPEGRDPEWKYNDYVGCLLVVDVNDVVDADERRYEFIKKTLFAIELKEDIPLEAQKKRIESEIAGLTEHIRKLSNGGRS